MKRIEKRFGLLLCAAIFLLFALFPTRAVAEEPLITTVDALVEALAGAEDGDVLLVGDVDFQKMPAGMIPVTKAVTVKSGKQGNARFTNATFALNGTVAENEPMRVRFENIDFRGDKAGSPPDTEDAAAVSSTLPGIMKTMCAVIFKYNVDATFTGCSFEGYHYGYGGVMNAIYSSSDNQNVLRLSLFDCTFSNNAGSYGGCLYLSGYGRNVTLDARRCIFSDNAGTVGGAIYAESAEVDLFACNFLRNKGQTSAATPAGGAAALVKCESTVDGCVFSGNGSAGAGGAIYGEISPFRTLVLKNSTLIGNRGASDEGIALVSAETNFSTKATAHLYFSTIFGEQAYDGYAEPFGCFFVKEEAERILPTAENGYCLTTSNYQKENSGTIPEGCHYPVPWRGYSVPRSALATVAGGKFADAFGEMSVGDNFVSGITLTLDLGHGKTETVTVPYGETFTPAEPVRAGYEFVGWTLPDGTPAEGGVVRGGESDGSHLVAKWRFVLSENLYVIWAPVLTALVLLTLFYIFKRRKGKTENLPVPEEPIVSDAAPVVVNAWFTAEEIALIEEKLPPVRTLTGREREVFSEMLEGKKQKEIAYDLGIEVTTVKDFYRKIYAKLSFSGKDEMLRKCSEIVSEQK